MRHTWPLWVPQLPALQRDDWVVDNRNTHWNLEVCRLVATWCTVPFVPEDLRRGAQRQAFLRDVYHEHVCHCTLTHGSWRNQVERWLSAWARRLLTRGDFDSAQAFATRLCAYLEVETPITSIRIVGRIWGNLWRGQPHAVTLGGNNVTDERG